MGSCSVPMCRRLLPRVHIETTDDVDPDMPTRSRFTQVTVELTDGTILQSPQVFHARGSAQTPLTREELWEKFRDCTSTRLSEIEARRVFDRLQDLERLKSVAEVLRAAVVGTSA